MKRFFVRCFLDWPDSLASHFNWLAPLFARFVVGWIFLWRGWDDFHSLHSMARDFGHWGIHDAQHVAPIISGIELAGGAFLLLGFLSRISAMLLAAIMVGFLTLTRWSDVHSVQAFVSFEETQFLAIFLWLAVAGAGPLSVDNWIQGKSA